MDSMDNFRERFEALERQTEQLYHHIRMAARRLPRWLDIACGVLLLSLLSLALPSQAADFACAAGDVACLINAINTANANGEANTITLEAGTYTLTAVDNDTDGPTGLPSIIGTLTLRGTDPHTTILGHMTGRQLLRRPGYDVDIEWVLSACAAHGVAIEINANPWRLDLDWRWHTRALELGCMMSINPDAHSIEEIDLTHWGVEMARKGGVSKERVLNCMSLHDFGKYLERRLTAARACSPRASHTIPRLLCGSGRSGSSAIAFSSAAMASGTRPCALYARPSSCHAAASFGATAVDRCSVSTAAAGWPERLSSAPSACSAGTNCGLRRTASRYKGRAFANCPLLRQASAN